MTKFECIRKCRSIQRQFKHKCLNGDHFPYFIPKCKNYIQLKECNYLPLTYGIPHSDKYRRDSVIVQKVIREFLSSTMSPEEAREHWYHAIYSAYYNLLKSELDMGILRIPCDMTRLDEDAILKSRFTNKTFNYSPIMYGVRPGNVYDIAAYFTEEVLQKRFPVHIAVIRKKYTTDADIHAAVRMTYDLTTTINQYNKEEYQANKDKYTYQYRNDIDERMC